MSDFNPKFKVYNDDYYRKSDVDGFFDNSDKDPNDIQLEVYVPQDGMYGLMPERGGLSVEEETCYLKSEADKLIDELKVKYNVQFCAKVSFWHQKTDLEKKLKVLNRRNYNYCLNRAEYCKLSIEKIKTYFHYSYNEREGVWMTTRPIQMHPKFNFYMRWQDRWTKLADKYKELL